MQTEKFKTIEETLCGLKLYQLSSYASYIFQRGEELIKFGSDWITFNDFCKKFPEGRAGNFRIYAFCGPPDHMMIRPITPAKLMLDWYFWSLTFRSEAMVSIGKRFEKAIEDRRKIQV